MADQALSYAIRLNSSGFSSGIRKATASLSAFRIAMANALVTKGFSLLQQAAQRFAATFRSALDLGSELTHLSAETGVAVSDLLVLRQAFQDCGVPASSLSTAIAFMGKALSGISETGQRTEQVFSALGLDIGELRKQSPADAFEAIGSAIGSLQSPAERTAAAIAIFGRSGASLNRVFANPEAIRQARDALGSMPGIMTTLSGGAEAWQTALGRVRTQIQGAAMGAMSGLLPVLEEIGKKMTSLDPTQLGLNIGAYLKQLWEDGLTGLFLQLAARCYVIGVAVWEALKGAFAPLSSGSTWKAIGKLAGGTFIEAGAVLLKGIAAAVSVLIAGTEFAIDNIKKGLNYIPHVNLETSGKSFGEHFDDAMQGASWLYQPGIDMGADLMAEGIRGVADAWAGAFDGWADAVTDSAGAQYLAAKAAEREKYVEGKLQEADYALRDEQKTSLSPPAATTRKAAPAVAAPPSATDQWSRIGAFAGSASNAVAQKHLQIAQRHLSLAEKTSARLQRIQEALANLEATT